MQPGVLKQDICDIRNPGTKRSDVDFGTIGQHISPVKSYACRHWVHHWAEGFCKLDDNKKIHELLQGFFFRWLEAMGWLGGSKLVPALLGRLAQLDRGVLLTQDASSRKVRSNRLQNRLRPRLIEN